MTNITFIDHGGSVTEVDGVDGQSVMQTALDNRVKGILGDCGGSLSCATCHGYVDAEWAAKLPPVSDEERAMLECAIDPTDESRLTCQIRLTPAMNGLTVRLPKSQL